MKTIKRLIFITLLLALTLAIQSNARAGGPPPPSPDINVYEWMNDPPYLGQYNGQYGIEIDSPDSTNWYILWFAVENPTAVDSWTNREFWLTELLSQTDFNNELTNLGWAGPFASTDIVAYYTNDFNLIGPNEYDDSFYWEALAPTSQYWAGVTMLDNGNGIEEIISGAAGAPDQEPIPEPATLLLLGTGLAGVGAIRRKRANKV